ncbi:hypothetical protein TAMA11512_22350 [Selenomonas sp. TAMA-11512]|uniref:DUF6470 family protein n=1 Tax=Selenomonas sp. TAMA-11512 TaxID=3095337 RepID=UPI003092A538|nr:hypothetical protein TAMA11512_22350 [Selenomonas sp. TAMA-11512]
MLSNMLYLNVHHQLPMIQAHNRLGTLDSHSTPARLTGTNRQAQTHQGVTQVRVECDTYESRKAYGFRNDDDRAREFAQKGFQGVRAGTSSHTQDAWHMIDEGAKPDSRIIYQMDKGKLQTKIMEQKQIDYIAIPRPTFKVTPSEVKGEIDTGDIHMDIETDAFADVSFNKGDLSFDKRIEGEIKMWTSIGHYERYA